MHTHLSLGERARRRIRATCRFAPAVLVSLGCPPYLLAHPANVGIASNSLLNGFEAATALVAAALGFGAARVYREGRLGRGMTWIAVGMVVMAVGHFILVVRRSLALDPLALFGPEGSVIAFSFAVFFSFIASAYGFWLIRRAARG